MLTQCHCTHTLCGLPSIQIATVKSTHNAMVPLVLKTFRKIKNDQATGIIVYPKWEAQPFWPLAMEMAVGHIFILSSRKNLLIHPTDSKKEHRMNQKLNLIMSLVSGKNVRGKDSPQNPVKFC